MKSKKFFVLFPIFLFDYFSRRILFLPQSDQLGNVVKVSTDNMASKLWKLVKLVSKLNLNLLTCRIVKYFINFPIFFM